jgi:transposase-like protein
MIPSAFRDFFINSDSLTQQEIVSSLLSLSLSDKKVADTSERKAVTCPHCSAKHIRANGKLRGVQRYICNGCKKNFSETTGKFWYNIKKKDKLNRYLYCLLSGYSIRTRRITSDYPNSEQILQKVKDNFGNGNYEILLVLPVDVDAKFFSQIERRLNSIGLNRSKVISVDVIYSSSNAGIRVNIVRVNTADKSIKTNLSFIF